MSELVEPGPEVTANYGEDLAWMRVFVGERRWRTARDDSHQYHVDSWGPGSRDQFEFAVSLIERYGEVRDFFGRDFTYWSVDGIRYWTMDESVAKTTLINRAE